MNRYEKQTQKRNRRIQFVILILGSLLLLLTPFCPGPKPKEAPVCPEPDPCPDCPKRPCPDWPFNPFVFEPNKPEPPEEA